MLLGEILCEFVDVTSCPPWNWNLHSLMLKVRSYHGATGQLMPDAAFFNGDGDGLGDGLGNGLGYASDPHCGI
ncbi:hypothetical protein BHYA_0072g00120 [Botrytis hyacinthi]|uniref:Uncharacterized protein n=1 Tax=Botrytis hyacinthi TaxID=278943 RepID=A0A4Z1GSF7_9HELO|nr:hypothetical protein BHYA_0072g00120 [Botrytis hyacinthi]